MREFTAEELTQRYNLSKAGLLKFVKANIAAINAEDKNVYQDGNKRQWVFTEKAVEIIDKLRKTERFIVEENVDLKKENELLQEISTLKTQLMLVQNELNVSQKKLIGMMEQQPILLEEKVKAETKLEVVEENLKRALEEAAQQQVVLNKKILFQEEQIAAASSENNAMRNELESLKQELAVEKGKPWWSRIFS
jgi:hypothetical protein